MKNSFFLCFFLFTNVNGMLSNIFFNQQVSISRKFFFKNKTPSSEKITPYKIKSELDKVVIGREKAKKVLATSLFYLPYKEKKSNVLLMGPTGCGKTLLIQTVASIMKIPCLIENMGEFSGTGYAGRDCEDILMDVYYRDGEIKGCLVFLDEIDKIASPLNKSGRDISGEDVQNNLLPMLGGSPQTISAHKFMLRNGYDQQRRYRDVTISTKKIVFIGAGAFHGLDKIIAARTGLSINNSLLKYVELDDFVNYGFKPEFIGRFAYRTVMDNLNKHSLIDILTKPRDAIIPEYERLFSKFNKKLVFDKDALNAIAEKALSMRTGARGLRTIADEILLEPLFKIPSLNNVMTIRITKDVVENNTSPIYYE